MSFECKRKNFLIVYLLIQTMAKCSAENNGKINNNLQNRKLGEFNPESPFCNKNIYPVQKNQKTDHVPFAEENEKCVKTEDCCGALICLHGICRMPTQTIELATLVKVCLGITITVILVGMFGALIKCLIRYDRLQTLRRCSDSWSLDSRLTPVLNTPPPLFEIQDEKPPSYEECVSSSEIKQPPEQAPPFIISSNSVMQNTNIQQTIPKITNLEAGEFKAN